MRLPDLDFVLVTFVTEDVGHAFPVNPWREASFPPYCLRRPGPRLR